MFRGKNISEMSDVLNVLLQVLHKIMLVTQITSESYRPFSCKSTTDENGGWYVLGYKKLFKDS